MLLRLSVVPDSAERIDRFLSDQLAISRTKAARIVADGSVMANSAGVRRSYRPARGDVIEVNLPDESPPRKISRYNLPLDFVFEDDHMMAIDKPAGLVVHPAPGHWDDTLLNALMAHGVSVSGGEPGRHGIVHRLDKDTSGLMIVARTESAHEKLSRAIAKRHITREYAALVWGHVEDYTEIDAPIMRNPSDRKRMLVSAGGRPAVSHVMRVARFNACDLVRVRLETGRTHQIRVHLAHIGHPVVGDPVYGGGGARRISGPWARLAKEIDASLDRQALHAASLRLKHPATGADLELRAEWPVDLRATLAKAAEDDGFLDRENSLEYLGFFGHHDPAAGRQPTR